jgi:hypothetical protein
MHKRYEMKYGRFIAYDVVKETEKMFVYSETRNTKVRESRRSKDGTFLSVRETLENEAEKYGRRVANATADLQSAKSSLGQIEAMLKKPDDKLEAAIAEIKRF